MEKQIVFIGGIHGAGKSTVCRCLTERYGWPTVKQRRILIAIGAEEGLAWPEVGTQYDQFILPVAERMLEILKESTTDVLLVDCHYAIAASVAVRATTPQLPEFITNLDWRLVERVMQEYRCRFVLLEIDPVTAVSRLEHRTPAEHYHNSVDHFSREAVAERDIFRRLIAHFSVRPQNWMCLGTTELQQMFGCIANFIQS